MRPASKPTLVGHLAAIWRYPVKSMQGESLSQVSVRADGLEGDRRFAVIDRETGNVASAKNPRKWAGLLQLRAELRDGVLKLSTPEGKTLDGDFDEKLSALLGRRVSLRGTSSQPTVIEVQWPDVPGLSHAGTESVEELAAGRYFDLAPIHIITTGTLRRMRELGPEGNFDFRRFRPNLVIDTLPAFEGFVENDWIEKSLHIGETQLRVTAPCSRCVMTTLVQPDLPADPQILRAVVQHNHCSVGVYASPVPGGLIAVDAEVWLE